MDLSTMWFGAAQTTGVFSTIYLERTKSKTNKQLSEDREAGVGFPYATIRLIKSTEKMWKKKLNKIPLTTNSLNQIQEEKKKKKKQKPKPKKKKSKSIENDFIEVFTATLSFDRQVVSSAICCVRRRFG